MSVPRYLRAFLAPAAMLGLAACAQPRQNLPLPEAERYCSQNLGQGSFGMRAHPRLSVGIGSGGHHGGYMGIDFSPEYSRRIDDPEALFRDCVISRSGQAPSRSLYQMPGWGGAS
ncbi:hypothetical protein SAMN04487972_102157 [Paracoccus halophilus]|uniref:Lipoprotein n=1 Tax=Paracoccus halophilus TaxID=376733 RepID=A0A099F976_9RHOB|nr:hypothetical protein [Paracoccus halophilus]KGJ06786.1 hypothetical protein IT41_01010 [Paracoccus halophilus]SFA41589.1 hypothetical protein SAMN04487972_102157 [Paracoccus halophilus]